MVLESKAREEQSLVPSGHQAVNLRIRAHFSEADWAAEQMRGISYLFFLRRLAREVDDDWPAVLSRLQEIHRILVNRNAMILNITLEEKAMGPLEKEVHAFLDALPEAPVQTMGWSPEDIPPFEGMTIPAQVNYVGKGMNLFDLGYRFRGSTRVVTRYLRNVWLWERVRMQGGAYGAFCLFDRLSGVLTFVSYRDPNLAGTIEVFDRSSEFLTRLDLSEDELTRSIIGTIGDMDQHMLPDTKGYTSMLYHLTGETEDERQRMREEALGTEPADFRAFGEVLKGVAEKGLVKVLGSKGAIDGIQNERPGWLEVMEVL
jgi:Zn-dependent M16 (insulinase) family peptidase